MIRGIVVGALALLMGAIALAADIDDTRLLAAATDPASWLTYGRDYGNQRFSPLSGIDASNVTRLAPRWIYQSGVSATFQATPIVADGVMYVSLPFNDVVAVDARTGREQWRYQHQRRRPAMCCGPANRGVAVAYGLVYEATVDARLIALDQKTGRLVWEVPLVEDDPGVTEHSEQLAADDPVRGRRVMGSTGVSANMAPLVYKSRVIVGITGVGYGLHLDSDRPGAPVGTVIGIAGQSGRAGFYAAFEAKTGKRLWKFDTTAAQGWEGRFVRPPPTGHRSTETSSASERRWLGTRTPGKPGAAQPGRRRRSTRSDGSFTSASATRHPRWTTSPDPGTTSTRCRSSPWTSTRASSPGTTRRCRTTCGATTWRARRCSSTPRSTVGAFPPSGRRAKPAGFTSSTVATAGSCTGPRPSCLSTTCSGGRRRAASRSRRARAAAPAGRPSPTTRAPGWRTWPPSTCRRGTR